MKKIFFQGLIFIFLPFFAHAQVDSIKNIKGEYCNPLLPGMGPSKGVEITYERVFDSKIKSVSRDPSIGNASAIVGRNNRLDIKVKIPIINKADFKMIAEARYFYEEFQFEMPGNLQYGIYKDLQAKHLKTIGGNLNILKSLKDRKYMIFRGSADVNGNYSGHELPKSDFVKYSLSYLYGWKKCQTKATAIGVFANYALGRRSVFPVLLYNNSFSKHFGVELLLPAFAKARINFSEKALLYFGYEVDGASYSLYVDNPPLDKYAPKNLQLRRSNLKLLMEFEHEILHWLWFGIQGGLRQPISFNFTTSADKKAKFDLRHFQITKADPLIRNTLSAAPYINFSLFLVVSKTLEDKLIREK